MLGTFTTTVRLHPEVKVEVECTVARSVEEASMIEQKAAEFLERQEDAEKLAAAGGGDEEAVDDNADADASEDVPAFDDEDDANA